MEKVNQNQAGKVVEMNGKKPEIKGEVLEPKKHLRLKVDLQTWHLFPFTEPLQFQTDRVTGKQIGFLCFVFLWTVRK